MDLEEIAQKLAVLCEKHNNLENVVIEEKRRLNHNLERIGLRLDDLNEMLGGYRLEARHANDSKPSWGITLAITTLTGAVVGLATFLLTH